MKTKERERMKARAAKLEALTLKRYKVSVLSMALHNFTVMATSDQEAHDKVLNQKPGDPPAGRDAGREGPVPFAVRVHDMSNIEPAPTLQTMMNEVTQAISKGETAPGDHAPKPLVEVVQ